MVMKDWNRKILMKLKRVIGDGIEFRFHGDKCSSLVDD